MTVKVPQLPIAGDTRATSKQSVKAVADCVPLSSGGLLGCGGLCLCRSGFPFALSSYCGAPDSTRTRFVHSGYGTEAKHVVESN